MEAWQQRVVDEKAELDKKLEKLKEFNQSDAFAAISSESRMLLSAQAVAMHDYSLILKKRIENF